MARRCFSLARLATAVVLGVSLVSVVTDVPSASARAGVVLYASPKGSGNSCTKTQPCSLSGAQAAARGAVSLASKITVLLKGGTYRLTAPLTFDSNDNGFFGSAVTYTAAPGAKPVFSGGRKITGWKRFSAARKIWVASAPGLKPTRQLYVNGRRATVASAPVSSVFGRLTLNSNGYQTKHAGGLAPWDAPADQPNLHYLAAPFFWGISMCGIKSVSGSGITMDQPCLNNLKTPVSNWAPDVKLLERPAYVENNLALLNQPGQFYADTSAGKVYYKPRPGESMRTARVIAPQIPVLVQGSGVEDLTLSGVTFAYTAWSPAPSIGFVNIQSNIFTTTSNSSFDSIPAAVTFAGSDNTVFARNRLLHLGGAGLSFEDGGTGNSAIGNLITDVSASGITIANPIKQPERNDTVSNNYVHHVALEYEGGAGIVAGEISGTTISHNELWALNGAGIMVGWNKSLTGVVSGGILTSMTNNHIDYNFIHDFNQSSQRDAGAIYVAGSQNGGPLNSSIIGNYATLDPHPFGVLYLEAGASNIKVSRNVVSRTSTNWIYIQVPQWGPAATRNQITDNYSDTDSRECLKTSDRCPPSRTVDPSNDVSNNHLNLKRWPPAAKAIMRAAGLEKAYAHLRRGPADRNLAHRRPVTVSTTDAINGVPRDVNDGSSWTGWTTPVGSSQTWWQTDLGSRRRLSEVSLLTNLKRFYPRALSGITIVVSNTPISNKATRHVVCEASKPGLSFQGKLICPVPKGAWRYVGIVAPRGRQLSVAEFRAYGH